jgi:hypothetical protein
MRNCISLVPRFEPPVGGKDSRPSVRLSVAKWGPRAGSREEGRRGASSRAQVPESNTAPRTCNDAHATLCRQLTQVLRHMMQSPQSDILIGISTRKS